jgi:phosphoglycerate dehydrogenase-like enzyme
LSAGYPQVIQEISQAYPQGYQQVYQHMSEEINILITTPLAKELIDQISQVSDRFAVNLLPAREASEIPAEVWENIEVLYTLYTLPQPEQAPQLKWVQSHSAGIDRIRDAEIFKSEEVQLTTISGANASQVAEHALAMMLALGRLFPELFSLQQRTEWMTNKSNRYLPRELRGSTVGIVGYGSVGRQIARLLHGFGAQVLATKRDVKQPEDSGYIPEHTGDPGGDYFTRLYPPQALRSMFKECDFVVVTVPHTRRTTGMISAAEISTMKPGAFLIDVSCGTVVDHSALVTALTDGHLGGAALDVFPLEPLPTDHPLWTLPNVIITPHVAGFSPNYDTRANELFLENLYRYVANDPLLNLVDFSREY